MTQNTYYIGVDGGGTKCRVRLEDEAGNLLGVGVSGSANIMRDLELTKTSILHAIEQAIEQSSLTISLSQCVVGAGLAGANVPSALSALESWAHPFKSLAVLSDLHAACLGAHGGSEGAAIIIGTGSSGTRLVDGKFVDVGGHGFPIGDFGSGAWLGLTAIQHTLQVMDELKPAGPLSQAVIDHYGVRDSLQLVQRCSDFTPRDYAALVPLMMPLFEANDPQVSKIYQQGADYIQGVANRLLDSTDIPLCLIGGLSEVLGKLLDEPTRQRLRACAHSPEQGAIFYAKNVLTFREKSA